MIYRQAVYCPICGNQTKAHYQIIRCNACELLMTKEGHSEVQAELSQVQTTTSARLASVRPKAEFLKSGKRLSQYADWQIAQTQMEEVVKRSKSAQPTSPEGRGPDNDLEV